MHKVLISACLMGQPVRYDGGHSLLDAPIVQQWQREGRLVTICPEMAGGLPTPRPPAEIEHGNSDALLRGQVAIHTQLGDDITDAFLIGAEQTLALCLRHHIRIAILKEGSPSCGVTQVHDGTFRGHKIQGQGVTTRLLTQHGIAVFSEQQLEAASQHLDALEQMAH